MPQDATKLLEEDHEKVRTLFDDIEEAEDSDERLELLEKVAMEIRIHSQIEEEIFYPAVREAMGTRDGRVMVEESLQEHSQAEKALGDLENVSPDSAEFEGKVQVLRELVEHHASEEEDEMFKDARDEMDKDRLKELGGRMEARKKELMQEYDQRRVEH